MATLRSPDSAAMFNRKQPVLMEDPSVIAVVGLYSTVTFRRP
jgi:hypothetical protein